MPLRASSTAQGTFPRSEPYPQRKALEHDERLHFRRLYGAPRDGERPPLSPAPDRRRSLPRWTHDGGRLSEAPAARELLGSGERRREVGLLLQNPYRRPHPDPARPR